MNKFFKKNNQRGAVLVEVLVVMAIFSVFLTVVMRAMLSNLQATIDARVRSNGNFHAQQSMEMFIRERALLGWSDFRTEISAWNSLICINGALLDPATEVLGDFPANDPRNSNSACPTGYGLVSADPADGTFRREALITATANEVVVSITVYWPSSKSGTLEHHTTIENSFQDW